jgi:oligopeptide transport system substrate-binding protein
MARNLLGIGAVFAVALFLVGLTFSTVTEEPADLAFVSASEPKTLDPHVMTGQLEGRFGDALFEGLTYRHPETLKPTPGVAERWEISPDKKTYRFFLRRDARWSDGRPVTAQDFTWSWRRLQQPELGSEYAYILHMVRHAQAFNLYGNHVKRLREEVVPAFRELVKSSPAGVAAPTWQRFVATSKLNDAVSSTPEAAIIHALALKQGTLDAGALEALGQALGREADRRAEALKRAQAHFGVDEGIYAVDDHTLVVELLAPTPYFLELTGFYSSYPVPRHVIEAEVDGEKVNEHDWFLPHKIVGNGPYTLAAWRVNEKIRLVRSETYWGRDEVALGIVDALPIENASTALNLFLRGDVDWNTNPPPLALVDTLKHRMPEEYVRNPAMTVYFYRFHCTKKPFDDLRVRKAFAMAVDRRDIVDHVLRNGQEPALGIVPPGLPGYESPPSPLAYDPAKARALLAEAGYPGGKGFPKVALLYNTSEQHEQLADVVAGHLRRNLGVEVAPFNQEWQAYQASQLAMEYDLCRAGWIGDYADPNTFLDMWITNGGNNQTGWSNALYDRLIAFAADVDPFLAASETWLPQLKEKERAEALVRAVGEAEGVEAVTDAKATLRMHLLREAEGILVEDGVPILTLYFYVNQNLVRPWVKGWHPNPQDLHPLRGLRIERETR